jgi:hypothetical protein
LRRYPVEKSIVDVDRVCSVCGSVIKAGSIAWRRRGRVLVKGNGRGAYRKREPSILYCEKCYDKLFVDVADDDGLEENVKVELAKLESEHGETF